ncbi:hypothetical protein J5H37_06590 [Stenotrophomonas maltophilia]|uniref:hypothetical protein n=1 Tax=Stenotrophomonas maltophilia TaxID=40324 RepID=UPI0019D492F1|nr:hypothetical protein [Stenotrophomonas maltophilia]MBN7831189.1 hypothetical protein [Stenotrophomonas maltophilia]MBN7832748.1 hypothetical protein [Stenotrophomonas maltophilia]MBN7860408.1 hypothetical protein [Stenotrophomonas maltophilia]MBN7918751.1 hypothetical protein [Stenotrophomonas maltophilia]MBO2847643.1 hypothetical protein [Stenotrophomonas maltophilia]
MKSLHSRAKIDLAPLTARALRKIVGSLFHRRHDYGDFEPEELLDELARLGVTTAKQFRLLMKKHRRAILRDERARMSRRKMLYLLDEFGPEGLDMHTNTSWFATSGLVRQAIEKEFGWEAFIALYDRQPGAASGSFEKSAP